MNSRKLLFFRTSSGNIIAVETTRPLSAGEQEKLVWLMGNAAALEEESLDGLFVGPRREMITPWSTSAVEAALNIGISGIARIEEFFPAVDDNPAHDHMLQRLYHGLGQHIFTTGLTRNPVKEIDDIEAYNRAEGLALNAAETDYLEKLSGRLGRRLTDSEVFGFSQVNSEHCRHKIFNGIFIIDGAERPSSLFRLIRLTTETNPNRVVSAYKDNCALLAGPEAEQFAPNAHESASLYGTSSYSSVLTLKAETHNFPTTVEPYNGGATGSGGEIRDRIAGGRGALPLAGTAVLMTSYPRSDGAREWERFTGPRQWLYQSPAEILIKASDGAGDYGSKFGQPLICGSLLTFEYDSGERMYGFDKVIMLAGGIGMGRESNSLKGTPRKGDLIVMLGGDNYRIGMGGGAVSSVDTGAYGSAIEMNAIQRSNPEMQKRVYNVLRAMTEGADNPIISLHDHGAGGHLNCLSELVEQSGGVIDTGKLPVGDPSLSALELIGNESQERMGLVVPPEAMDRLMAVAQREQAPVYVIGEVTGDRHLLFHDPERGERPIDLKLDDFFGKLPRTVMRDNTAARLTGKLSYDAGDPAKYLDALLQLEEVACKDWLTNKADRSATGLVAMQQCAGELQLPLNDLGAVALDFRGKSGMAVALGHAPAAALLDAAAGSVLAMAEALTNIVWAPLADGLQSVSLSANWMWPCKNTGEDARLYEAVEAASNFAIKLGINIPTGKDSLSMTQKYPDGMVYSPGTVIITAVGEVADVRRIAGPVLKRDPASSLIWIDMSGMRHQLGGSAFCQTLGSIGDILPGVADPGYFRDTFEAIQQLVREEKVMAGHDISAGGMIVTLLEMCFANSEGGIGADLTPVGEDDNVRLLYSQNPGVIIQVADAAGTGRFLAERGVRHALIGRPVAERKLIIVNGSSHFEFDIDRCRNLWFRSSYLLDRLQCRAGKADERMANLGRSPVHYELKDFRGTFADQGITTGSREIKTPYSSVKSNPETTAGKAARNGTAGRPGRRVRAAVIREKGTSGERELAYALWLAGFEVKDLHMTDLTSGKETLEDVNMIAFAGGSSHSDVMGSARGWAATFRFNAKAASALERFLKRDDTLSLGICNGCQLMIALGVTGSGGEMRPMLEKNDSGKFEAAFTGVKILKNNSVMLSNLSEMELGVWIAHGEGKFILPGPQENYNIVMKYSGSHYPANPNGSIYDTAAICSADGRHLAMMPHIERAVMPWQCACYPHERRGEEVTPWLKAFVNAREWIERKRAE